MHAESGIEAALPVDQATKVRTDGQSVFRQD
jgi:hypothetical protein